MTFIGVWITGHKRQRVPITVIDRITDVAGGKADAVVIGAGTHARVLIAIRKIVAAARIVVFARGLCVAGKIRFVVIDHGA